MLLLLLTLLFSNLNYSLASNEETNLRKLIFKDYDKYTRPVTNSSSITPVTIGIAVQNIESFDQIEETIKLNVWLRKYWTNDFLKWNTSQSALPQLTIDSTETWTPDIELLNAATKPDIYTLKGGMYLYNTGNMLWSMPSIYKFSCSLDLHNFPFDSQDCVMKFGSWSYDNTKLSLKPHGTDSTQIDVLSSFSHSEWNLDSYYVKNYTETRDCCGSKLFDINEYHFKLDRYTHYYKLNMGMTIALVVVSFIIMLVKADNLSRTGTAVFIPLTILALQLTIAGKIPVVGYYTLMDQFFLTCFITSMAVSIESGIVYALITSKSHIIFKVFNKILDYDKILAGLEQTRISRIKEIQEHHVDLDIRRELINQQNINNTDQNLEADEEYRNTENILMSTHDETDLISSSQIEDTNINNTKQTECVDGCCELSNNNDESIVESNELNCRTESYAQSMSIMRKRKVSQIESTNLDSNKNYDLDLDNMNNNNIIVTNDIVKIIDFDNQNLTLSYKEYILFNDVTRLFIKIDNIFRVFLPSIFFIIILVIFSKE